MDGAVALRPAVAVMEVKAGRQGVAAHGREGVLVDDQHARAEFGAPRVGVQETRPPGSEPLRLDDERREQDGQVPGGDHEIMHHPERVDREGAERGEPAVGIDAVEEEHRARVGQHADVPNGPVDVLLGVCAERQSSQVVAPVHEALGRQRIGIDLQRGAALPERQEAARVGEHGRVGDVHVVRARDRAEVRWKGSKRRQQAPPGPGLAASFRGVEDAAAVRRSGAVEGACLDHAVAVEPMTVAVAEALVFRGSVAPQGPGQVGRQVSGHGRERGSQSRRRGVREGQETRVPGQRCREILPPSGVHPEGEEHGGRREGAQRVAAREPRGVHSDDSRHLTVTTARTARATPAPGPTETAAASKVGGPMKPRASLEKP